MMIRTLVLPVEGTVPAPTAQGVRFCVSLTENKIRGQQAVRMTGEDCAYPNDEVPIPHQIQQALSRQPHVLHLNRHHEPLV